MKIYILTTQQDDKVISVYCAAPDLARAISNLLETSSQVAITSLNSYDSI